MILARVKSGLLSLNSVPLAGPDFELVLVLYGIAKFILKARLHPKLLYTFSRAFLQCIRVFAEDLENLSLLSLTFPLFNDDSFNRWMGFFTLNPLFELADVLVFLRQEIEVGLKVCVNDQDSL